MKRSSKSRELAMEVTVGTFMFVVLLSLVFFTMILSREAFFQTRYSFEAVFSDVLGLRDGDNVVMRGMDIGKVKKLEIKHDGVYVTASLKNQVILRTDYRVEIVPTSVLGGRHLQIDEGTNSAALLVGQIPVGRKPHDLIKEASAVVADFKDMTRMITSGQGTVGKLIYDETLYKDLREVADELHASVKQRGLLARIEGAVSNINEITAKINTGDGTIGKLVNDPTLYNDARDVISEIKLSIKQRDLLKNMELSMANLRDISDKINKGQGAIGKLVNDTAMYDDARKAVSNLTDISEKINRGQGSLGKLVNDDALYNDAKKMVNNVNAIVDDYRETSPIVTFSSIFFGAF